MTNTDGLCTLSDCFPSSPPPAVTTLPRVGYVYVLLYFYNMDPHTALVLCVLKLCVNDIRPRGPLQLVALCLGVAQVDIQNAGSSVFTAV